MANQLFKDKLDSFLLKDKNKNMLIIIGLLGVGLLFVSKYFKKNDAKETLSQQNTVETSNYQSKLEEELKNTIEKIEGVADVKVMITLENSYKNVYAAEEKTNKEETEDKACGETSKRKEVGVQEMKYIKIRSPDGGEKALYVTQVQPTVKGVVVVCSGAEDEYIKKKVENAVKTALNISGQRVCVTR